MSHERLLKTKGFRLDRAFTLIEVALAIAILGIGLATITTLSTRLVDDTYYEVGRSNGTILALYILETQTVSSTDAPTGEDDANQNQAGAIIPKLDALGFFTGLDKEQDFPYLTNKWNYELKFEPLSLPFTETSFNIVTSIVSWGPSDFETVHLQTIVKVKDNPAQQNGAQSGSQPNPNLGGEPTGPTG